MTSPLLAPMPERIRCVSCGADVSTAQVVAAQDYRCNACQAELAHLDLAPNGMVRSVLGWLRPAGYILNDRYRIRGFLGKGGFAATYLVEDLRLNGKRRAAKEIPEIFFDERETEILSRIQHPCVPDITDRFMADGMVYLVLEFGGDRTLETVRAAEGGRIPLTKLRPWLEQLCDALSYLHSQSPPIVHRDLKPANILLDEADRVMLIDFGIAKQATPDMATRTIARSASHGFSPPEQVLGTGTDQRSDVYALGATTYVLLTGEIPPPAHERVAGADVVPPRRIAPEIPLPIEEAILRSLELNVAKRQSSIEEFRRVLGRLPAMTPQPGRTTTAPRTVAIAGLEARSPDASTNPTPLIAATVPGSRDRAGIRPGALAGGIAIVFLLASVAVWAVLLRGSDDASGRVEPPMDVVKLTPEPGPTPGATPPASPDASASPPLLPSTDARGAPPPGPSPSEIFNNMRQQSRPEPPVIAKPDPPRTTKPPTNAKSGDNSGFGIKKVYENKLE